MKIDVSMLLIKEGKAESHCQCPVALALMAAGLKEVNVGRKCFRAFSETSGYIKLPLPHSARDFIKSFDAGNDVEPFSFDVDLTLELLPVM